ncbi:MAG TPA: glycosyltransferase family 2 protein [Thermodesulfovibrionales bacterium]|nr:glycosyltransferase family 2 protein [Thermodesulfovibrionales bacterium]
MYSGYTIALLLPARNEELALPPVFKNIPPEIDYTLVVDNGSVDDTAAVARKHGAIVISEKKPGYGNACLAGIEAMTQMPPDIIAFADADGSDDVSRLGELLAPLVNKHADFVLEKRVPVNPDALSFQQRFGNRLATSLMRLFWGHTFTDLGPMRVMRWKTLKDLNMRDKDFGWTIEMQIKALQSGLSIREVPLPYRKRAAGRSKISRTLSGTLRAGTKIIWVILREALSGSKRVSSQPRSGDTRSAEQTR